jgi:Acetyltransferase (GNAT) domain
LKMSVYEIDPLSDHRWNELLQQHPRASIFHSRAWLNALRQTYDYEPVAYTTTASGAPLANGWVFCRIRSWLTGRRLVSLPFSDHCEPLIDDPAALQEISRALLRDREAEHWKYIECRLPSESTIPGGFGRSDQFYLHKLDIEPDLEQLFDGLHRSSTQRKIKRAQREALTCEQGCSEDLLDKFYPLLLLTRRRHRVPPQPRKWFSNLLSCFGNRFTIWVASNQGTSVASIITIRFKDSLVYKYGATDRRFVRFGGMQLLLWRAIIEAKKSGLREVDLGRSDLHDKGLGVFKDRLGAASGYLTYFRNSVQLPGSAAITHGMLWPQKHASCVPHSLMMFGGRLLYRHFG